MFSEHFLAQQYQPLRAYFGAHFNSTDDLEFYKAEVTYDYLADWVGKVNIKPTSSSKDGVSKYEFEYPEPADAVAHVSIGTITVSQGSKVETKWEETRTAILTEKVSVVVEPTSDMSFENLLSSFINPMRDLITLGTYKPNTVTNISVYSTRMVFYPSMDDRLDAVIASEEAEKLKAAGAGDSQQPGNDSSSQSNLSAPQNKESKVESLAPSAAVIEATKKQPIQVFFSPRVYNDEAYIPISEQRTFFMLKDVDNFDYLVNKWLELEEQGRNAGIDLHQLLLSGSYSPAMSPDQSFVTLTRAAEAYYKIDTSDSSGAKLWYAMRWLVDVGEQLTSSLPKTTSLPDIALFPNSDMRECFIQKAVNTRNNQTHIAPAGHLIVKAGEEIAITNNVLYFLFQAYMLQKLKIKQSRRSDIVRRNPQYMLLYVWINRYGTGCTPDPVDPKYLSGYLRSVFPISTN